MCTRGQNVMLIKLEFEYYRKLHKLKITRFYISFLHGAQYICISMRIEATIIVLCYIGIQVQSLWPVR